MREKVELMSLVIKKYCVPTFLEIFTNSDAFVNGYKAIESKAVNFGKSLIEEYDRQKK